MKVCPVCGWEWGDSTRFCASPLCVMKWSENKYRGSTPELIKVEDT